MLKLDDIKKEYKTADITVRALKGISVNFRKCEFVSVLGQSGCGKTTLLNVIGGLDHPTDGDLVIEGRSTKGYTSRDWDRYRNRCVGFIFQSYNLIPHLTVLQNVELALTISGVSRKKKLALAVTALDKVGLGQELKKKPNELSGGQMQRVAIARAIVNDPEIILADEPTGALDTKTSKQVMDILKEIASDRLVIMVTHNPALAEEYSTRIINLNDGLMEGDTMPYSDEEEAAERAETENAANIDAEQAAEDETKRVNDAPEHADKADTVNAEISDNDANGALTPEKDGTKRKSDNFHYTTGDKSKTKKRRKKEKKPRSSMSFFTALSLSGRNLVTKKARTVLTSFAGSIGIIGIALVLSLSNGFNLYMDDLEESTLSKMPIQISSVSIDVDVDEAMNAPNEENAFPDYDYIIPSDPSDSNRGVKISANILTDEYVEYVKQIDPSLLSSIRYKHDLPMHLLKKTPAGDVKPVMSTSSNEKLVFWQELLWDNFMMKQYDVIAGGYPGSAEADAVHRAYDPSFSSYDETGKKARQAVLVVSSANTIEKAKLEELGYELELDENGKYKPIQFDKILGKQIVVVDNDDYYVEKDDKPGFFEKKESTPENLNAMWSSEKSIPVTVVGVLRIKEDMMVSYLNRGLGYSEELTNVLLDNAADSEIARAQELNKDYNVLTGNDFNSDFSSLISFFGSYELTENMIVSMIKAQADEFFAGDEYEAIREGLKNCNTINDIVSLLNANGFPPSVLKAAIAFYLSIMPESNLDFEITMKILNNGYDIARQQLGALDRPSEIYIYPNSFASKQEVRNYLDNWNETHSSSKQVSYTDMASTVSEVMSRTVNIVSYILIAFAAISLIVSSVMIGIITYISVLERTTEIGVLRSIGARKIDIANVFNAETMIIGLASGLIGVILAWLLDFPINALLYKFVEYAPKSFAVLNPLHALLLVVLSVVLTVLSGLLPASMASKRDPVKALRSNG